MKRYKLIQLPGYPDKYRIFKKGLQDDWICVGYYYKKNEVISGSFAIGDMIEIVNCCNEIK